jgi:two-component system chemotaxis response regulator CheY
MSLNILIVDDSRVMRAMILKTLKMSGLPLGEAYQAANGKEGLAQLKTNWVDLVIADINMPEMNGEEMIASIRANLDLRDTPIVVVSTEGSQTRIDALEKKGVRFIHKPFTPEQIRDTVMELIT